MPVLVPVRLADGLEAVDDALVTPFFPVDEDLLFFDELLPICLRSLVPRPSSYPLAGPAHCYRTRGSLSVLRQFLPCVVAVDVA